MLLSGYSIIDAHAHIYPQKIAAKATDAIGRFYGVPMACTGTVTDRIASDDCIGVSRHRVHSTPPSWYGSCMFPSQKLNGMPFLPETFSVFSTFS